MIRMDRFEVEKYTREIWEKDFAERDAALKAKEETLEKEKREWEEVKAKYVLAQLKQMNFKIKVEV